MISVPFFCSKAVFILGLGRSGILTAQALQASGSHVFAWDDNPKAREHAEERGILLQDPHTLNWEEIQAFIISPGIPHRYPAPHPAAVLADLKGLTPIGDIECFLRAGLEASVIGITGTNGKSTTTALIAHLLDTAHFSAIAAGNIGVPVLGLSPLPKEAFYVLELSSYQLELTPSLNLLCSVLLNLSPDHLERHGGMENYIKAKQHIFHQTTFGVMGIDDASSLALYQTLQSTTFLNRPEKLVAISAERHLENGVSCVQGILYDHLDKASPHRFSLEQATSLKGKHNHQNAAAAYAVARLLGISPEIILEGLLSFKGLAHRQEYVGTFQGIAYYNDSKATNPEAVEKALSTLGPDHTLYWIAGGRPKQADLDALQGVLPYIKHAFIIGEAVERFPAFLQEHQIPHKLSYTLEEACSHATQKALEDQNSSPLVLLSPACTSFDQFRDFEHRGDVFKAWVLKHQASPSHV